ncbi:MAG TPA: hypothetical protein V6C58_27970 [Allocoleopsis sp.]
MTNLPDDDTNLVAFMRQNRPIPPAANPDLEMQILAQIDGEKADIKKYKLWVIPSIIGASLMMIFSGYNLWKYQQIASVDHRSVETFLVQNLDSVINDENQTPEQQHYMETFLSSNENNVSD